MVHPASPVTETLSTANWLLQVYDRIAKRKPLCDLRVQDGYVVIRIRNRLDEEILIDEIEMSPADDILGLYRTDDRQTETQARADLIYSTNPKRPVYLLLRPFGERFIRVSHFGRFEQEPDDLVLKMVFHWTRTRRYSPQWREWRSTVKTTVGQMRKLFDARH